MNKDKELLSWVKITNKDGHIINMSLYIPINNYQKFIDNMIKKYQLRGFQIESSFLEMVNNLES